MFRYAYLSLYLYRGMDQGQGELSHLPCIIKLIMIFIQKKLHLVRLISKIIAPIDQSIQMVLDCPNSGKGQWCLEAVQRNPLVEAFDTSLF